METFQIETAQNINISQKVAGLGERMLAYLIDILVLLMYIILISYSILKTKVAEDNYWLIMVFFLPVLLYSLLMETFFNGQTLGKMAANIRVVKLDGSRPRFSHFIIRWLLSIIDISISSGGVALLTIMLNSKGQRLGDIAAGTTVIKEKIYLPPGISQFSRTEVEETYQPVYPEVALLSDKDARKVREIFYKAKRESQHHLIVKLHEKLISLLHIQTDKKPIEFVETVLRDYNYFAQRQGF